MSIDRLLIVFGGTDEHVYTTLLEGQIPDVDVLQFNFVNQYPNIWVNGNKYLYLNSPISSWDFGSSRGAQRIKSDLKAASKKLWDDFTWTGVTTMGLTESDIKGLTTISLDLIQACMDKWDNPKFSQYEEIYVMAHSRGCLLAVNCIQGMHEKFGSKLKRIVLLDPVSMCRTNWPLTNNTTKFRAALNGINSVEFHIIVRGNETNEIYAFASSAPETLGFAKGTGYFGMAYRQTFSETISLPMKNVFVHISTGGHGKMLTSEYRQYFPHYMEIVSKSPWRTMYCGKNEIPDNVYSSKILADFMGNKGTAEHFAQTAGSSSDPLEYYRNYIYSTGCHADQQEGRFITLLQCLARKKQQR